MIQIKSRFTGKIILESKLLNTKAVLQAAVEANVDLRGAYLRDADLRDADLGGADLGGAYLRGAYLRDADLKKLQIVPQSGSFEAWKKGGHGHLIRVKIPAVAERVGGVCSRKCRASFVKVLEIIDRNNKNVESCCGWYDQNFIYRAGEIVGCGAGNFDPSPLRDCAPGIHFFLTRQEAEDWN